LRASRRMAASRVLPSFETLASQAPQDGDVPGLEGFWSIFKRGIVGTFHNVSKKYLHLYVAEFQFRYNNRSNDDIFGTAIEGA
jgi:hypothetical protein